MLERIVQKASRAVRRAVGIGALATLMSPIASPTLEVRAGSPEEGLPPIAYGLAGPEGGSVEFFDNDGNPLPLTVNGVPGVSRFDYDFPSNATFRCTHADKSDIKVGSAVLTGNNGDTATLAQLAAGGDYEMLLTFTPAESGVSAAVTFYRMSLPDMDKLVGYASVQADVPRHVSAFPFADYLGPSDQQTGVAIMNPSDEPARALVSAHFDSGAVESAWVDLAPRGHASLFLDELLGPLPSPGIAQVVGPDLGVVAITMYQGQLSTGQVREGVLPEAVLAYEIADLLVGGTNFSDPEPAVLPVDARVTLRHVQSGATYEFATRRDGTLDLSGLDETLPPGQYERRVTAKSWDGETDFVPMNRTVTLPDTPETVRMVPLYDPETQRPGIVPELSRRWWVGGYKLPKGTNYFAVRDKPWTAYLVKQGLDWEGLGRDMNELALATFNHFVTHTMPRFGIPVTGPVRLVEELGAGVELKDPYTFIIYQGTRTGSVPMVVGGDVREDGRIFSVYVNLPADTNVMGAKGLATEFPFVFGREDNGVTYPLMESYGVSRGQGIMHDDGFHSLYQTPFDDVDTLVKLSLPLLTSIGEDGELYLPAK